MGGNAFLVYPPPKNEPPGFVLPKSFTQKSVQSFVDSKTGPLYSLPESEAMAFVNTKYNEDQAWPDVQLFLASYADSTDGGLMGKRVVGLTDEFFATMFEEIVYKDAFSVLPLLMRPKSRGRILLRSKNPYDPPLIYPNYLSHPDDVKVLVRG